MALKEEEEEEKETLENWQSFPNKKTSLTRKQKQKKILRECNFFL
jgi:hypothetical protein